MKVALIYSTKTGHTKKIAEAMAKELGIEAQNIADKPVLNNVDLLLVGSGVYGGKISPELLAYLEGVDSKKVKKAIIFITSLSKKNQSAYLRDFLVRKGIEVNKDEFVCKGKFLFFSTKHPNEEDVKSAVEFVKKIAK